MKQFYFFTNISIQRLIISIAFLCLSYNNFSQIVSPFNIRYQTNQKGGITILSNLVLTCNSSNNNCSTYQNQFPPTGNHNQDGGITMGYVDIDTSPLTWMTSSDSLNLPICSEISWAGLYWSARVNTNTTNYATRNQVRIKVNNGAFTTLTADNLLDVTTIPGNPNFSMAGYYCFKNITNLVQPTNGNARFTLANIVAQTGSNNLFGAWSIVVVYKNSLQSMRNLTVFDGMAFVSNQNNLDIPISGFTTPSVGPVSFELGVIAYEGDRNIQGDRLQFNGNGTFLNVPDPLRNANDFFNSSITSNGALTPFRNPNYNNTLGYDAGIFSPNNSTQTYLPNSATSATVRVATSQDAILPRVITSAIDIYEPDLRATVYINDLNGPPAMPNDILEYTVIGKNIGSDISLNTFITDTLDIRTEYIPNTITFLNGPFIGPKTDGLNDDQAEYIAASRTIKARVNVGANTTTGGTMLNSSDGADSAVVRFRVRVVDDCIILSCDSTLENKAYIFGQGDISGNSYNNGGASDIYDANGCPSSSSNLISVFAPNCPTIGISNDAPFCEGDTLHLWTVNSIYANYLWTGPNNFSATSSSISIPNATSTNSGPYTLNVSLIDGSCAYNNLSDTVVIFPNPTIQQVNLTNITCNGLTNGSLNVLGIGNGPFTYSWNNNQTLPSLSNLAPGSYTVVATDVNTCKDTATYTVTQPSPLIATASKTSNYNGRDISCFGAANGSATVVYSGGTPPYLVSWAPGGQTTPSISNLGPGTYTATVTDANGCIKTSSVTLTQPPVISSSHLQINVSCFGGSNGSIDLTVGGGTPGYTYSWNNGATTQDISSLSAGVYSVTILDLNGCSKSHSVTITQPVAPLTLTSTQVNVLCFSNATGSINLSVSGGTTPYTYSWSNGAISQDISNLPAGTYSVTVTDFKGCTAMLSVSISQPFAPLSSSMIETNIACFGNATGSVNLSVSGGTSPYNFSWNNSALTEDIGGLLPGQYIVTITDNNGCILKDTANLSQPLAPLSISLIPDNADCFGTAQGSIDATVIGGTTPYSYNWSNGSSMQDITNLFAGTYILQVTDFNGCQLNADTLITQPPQIIINSTQVDVLCFGEATGSIDISIVGGISPFQYNWSNGATSEDITNLLAGNYTIAVTDNNNCSSSLNITILQPPQPLTLTITHTDALCVGGLQGTTNLTSSGGTSPYTYLWNNNQTLEDLSNLVAGYYYCTVTDNNGCSDTIGATILDPSNTLVPSISQTDVSCFAGSDGTVDLEVTGGLLPYSYNWNNGASSQDINALPTGNYFVTITDGNSCQSFISTFVDQPQAPLSTTQQITNVLCFSESTGAIDITTNGGTQPYSFLWNNGQTNEDLIAINSGSYQLTITDAKNCSLVVIAQISQPSDIQVSASTQNINCFGQATGGIDLNVLGGVMPYSYSWSGGQNTQDLSNIPAGTFQVYVTDNNMCQDSLSLTLTQPATPVQVTAVTTNISCFGGNNGSIDVTISGGSSPYMFNWSNAVVVQDQQNLYAGVYQINVTDNKGCTTNGIYNLTQPATPVTTQISMTQPLCFGNSNGTATVVASGGTPGYSYLWPNGQITPTLSGIPVGTYIVEVTDANNCKIKDTIIVTQPPLLSVNADSSSVSCWGLSDGSVQSSIQGGTGTYSYNWSPINVTTPTVGNLPAGVYTITVTDVFNCQSQASTEILQPDSLYATFLTTDILCNGFATGAIDATIFGGTAPYSYFCPTLLPNEDISNLTVGSYLYTVVDANGCSNQYPLVLSQPNVVSAIAQMAPVSCFGGSDGELDITTTGGIAPYSYLWSTSQTTEDINSLSNGNYNVQITDANNCVNTYNFGVTQPQQPISVSLSQVNVACFGDSTGSINLSVSGGTPNYSYLWNNSSLTQDIFSLDTGIYQVIVTDANGCLDSISTNITQPSNPISITESHVDILCFNASTGSINISVLGGTPSILNGYSYDWSNNQVTQDIQNLPVGTYEVIVTDSLLCGESIEVSLTQPQAPLDVVFDIENVKCFGDSTGSILAAITGGTEPYEFSWSNLDSTLLIDSLAWGNYAISLVDSNNCFYAETALVLQPLNPLLVTYTPIEPSCFGYSDGQLILNTTGGTPGYQYNWSTGDINPIVDSLVTGSYSVLVTDANGCTFELDCFLDQPAQIQPSFDSDILSGCSPLVVEFFNTSDANFNCEWTFGDSLSYSGCEDVVISFDTGGIYDVQLTAFDPNGCFNSISANDYITVYQTPVASFTTSPSILFPESPETNILNTSSDCEFYIWNMGVGDPDEMYFEPGEYVYPANIADTFLITLYAISSEGCADTAYQEIYFNNNPFYYVPNTFIPDGDNRNDTWTPVFSNLSNVKKYSVQVFDRWGEIVFESSDTSLGWDGTFLSNSCQDGTYIWKLQFTWYDKKVYYTSGHVNLLR